MEIRSVVADDMPALVELMVDYVVGFYQQEDQDAQKIKQHASYILANPREGTQFVLVEADKIQGFATLYYSYSTLRLQRIAILNDLFVSSAARGRGFGEALFKHCLEFAKGAGVAYLQWETTKDNAVAQSLYEKMGGELSDLLVYEIRFSGMPPQ